MSNLLASLRSAGESLAVYQRSLDTVQNNVTNSATPGYAKQSLILEARPFDLTAGLAGGVASRGLQSARSEYAEDEVRRHLQSLGFFEAESQASASVEALFDVSGDGGVPAALSELLQAFSAWSVAPGGADTRQRVISGAEGMVRGIRSLSDGLTSASSAISAEVTSTVDQINELTAAIQKHNVGRLEGGVPDPGQDANAHAALEQLSELVNVATLIQPDGTISVLLDGGSPLVLGVKQYALKAPQDGSKPTKILDWQSKDVAAQLTGGKIGGLLESLDRALPAIGASLDAFTQSFADSVNNLLSGGTVGPDDPTPGKALFTYAAAHPAATFALKAGASAAGLAAVDQDGAANGNPLKLASLATSTAQGGVNGQTFVDFFSGIAAAAGRQSADAQENRQSQATVVAQTRTLRDQTSRVSLDEEAILLLQFQRSYQAAAKLVSVLNDMAGDTINLIR
jgi:flagellar hook-associated protein 1